MHWIDNNRLCIRYQVDLTCNAFCFDAQSPSTYSEFRVKALLHTIERFVLLLFCILAKSL